ncbi:hypothetical protein WMY93_001658 [Mugilogobius chulae]|uniref:Uncharacterized protein n=1 Tax=Mugilogobius chulae TaxID=88201 RepID=A0AAW0Q161_9GOBI
MRTLDSGIGTIPLPESCSFFSSILHLLPKSSSTPEQALSPSVPGCSSPLPRWRVPSGVPSSLSDSSVPLLQSVPFPSVAFLQPAPLPSDPRVTAVCEPHSRLPRPQSEGFSTGGGGIYRCEISECQASRSQQNNKHGDAGRRRRHGTKEDELCQIQTTAHFKSTERTEPTSARQLVCPEADPTTEDDISPCHTEDLCISRFIAKV